MAVNLSDNIHISANLPIDSRYFNNLTPYSGTTEVNMHIPSGERYVGLTVLINGPQTGGNNKEYWYKVGIADIDLVLKSLGGTSVLTGATNGLTLVKSGTTAILGGTLTGSTVFNGGASGFTLQYAGDYSGFYTTRSLIDKGYADAIVSGLKPKQAVNLATTNTGPIVLSGTPTIDGVPTQIGMRILVKNQNGLSGASTNGVYDVSAGAWSRSADFDGTPFGEVTSGSYMWVLSGNTNQNSSWILSTPDPIFVGTTPLTFVIFSHVSDVVAGPGIIVTSTGGTHQITANAVNGLTATMGGIGLGGTLTGSTVVSDSRVVKKGIEYGGDYSSGFSNCSLITKEYAQCLISSGGTYNLDSPSVCAVGGMCINTVLTGKTAFEILSEILVPVVQPAFVAQNNSIVLSPANGSICEIGCILTTVSVTSNFSRGSYSPAYCGGTPYGSGLPNTHTFTGTGVVGSTGSTSLSVTRSTINYIVVTGTQSWTTSVSYDAGLQAKSSKGGNSTCPIVAAGTCGPRTASIIGAYPLYATTATLSPPDKQPILNMATANAIQILLMAEDGATHDSFQVPCAWLSGRPLTSICTCNSLSGLWEFEGGNAATSLLAWSCAPAVETIQGNSIGYCALTHTGAWRFTTTKIMLNF